MSGGTSRPVREGSPTLRVELISGELEEVDEHAATTATRLTTRSTRDWFIAD